MPAVLQSKEDILRLRNQRRLQALDAQLRLLEARSGFVGRPSKWRQHSLRRLRRKWEAVSRAVSLMSDRQIQSSLNCVIAEVQQSLKRFRSS